MPCRRTVKRPIFAVGPSVTLSRNQTSSAALASRPARTIDLIPRYCDGTFRVLDLRVDFGQFVDRALISIPTVTVTNFIPQSCILSGSQLVKRHLYRREIDPIHRYLPLIIQVS